MEGLLASASTTAQKAVAATVICVLHFDSNDPDLALEVVEKLLAQDALNPIDHAWLQVQKARALAEIGRRDEAFDLAMIAQRIGIEYPQDVTASAIAGSAQSVAFRTTHWSASDLGPILQGLDNRAAWWRSQTLGHGLSKHLTQAFRHWAGHGSITFLHADPAYTYLRSATLLASAAGDQSEWRNALSTASEHLLMKSSRDGEEAATVLTMLRRSGDTDSLAQAINHFIVEGPLKAVALAAAEVDLGRSTRTSASADLLLLRRAGDLLEHQRADDLTTWCLQTLKDDREWLDRTGASFILFDRIMQLLRSMVWSMSDERLTEVMDYCLSHQLAGDDGRAYEMAKLIESFPETAWSGEYQERAAAQAQTATGALRRALLTVSTTGLDSSRVQILQRARSGDLSALDAVEHIESLSPDAVDALIAAASQAIGETLREARNGHHNGGGPDHSRALAILSVHHPEQARWDVLLELLRSLQVASIHLAGLLDVLRANAAAVPSRQREQLLPILKAVSAREPHPLPPGMYADVRGLAAEAHCALSETPDLPGLARQLALGNAASRVSAARVAAQYPAGIDLLAALSGDRGDVRTEALEGLASRIGTNGEDSSLFEHLATRLENGGVGDANAIVRGVRRQAPRSVPATDLLKVAARHPSASVRHAADELLAFHSTSAPVEA